MTVTDVPIDGMPAVDPADLGAMVSPEIAPYGVTADGTPRAKPGRKPGQKATSRGSGGRFTSSKTPPPPAAKKTTSAPKTSAPDYRPGVTNLLRKVSSGLALGGLMRGQVALTADAAALDTFTPAAAELLHQAANQWAVVGVILDKVLAVGPYADGSLAALVFVGQVAVNHGAIPPGIVPGTVPPATAIETYLTKMAAEDPDFQAIIEHARQRAGAPAA